MSLEQRLERIEALLLAMARRQVTQEFYDVGEFAAAVGRSVLTCREWCRTGRINAVKKRSGRGAHAAWVISHDELLRYQREGLLRAN